VPASSTAPTSEASSKPHWQSVIADADVLAVREHGDRRIPLEAGGLVLDAKGHALRQAGDALDDPLDLRFEVDVAGSRQRRFTGPEADEQIDGPVERVEQLADASLLVLSEDRHWTGL